MRLISQDEMIDIPYESTNVSISYKEKNKIIAWGFGCEEHHIIDLGTYSSHEKAKKVMEMVRKAYLGIPVVLQNVEVPNDAEKFFGDKNIIYACIPEQKPKVEYLNNAVFQFPSDDEVEV